ncbi:MAG TPA: 5'/3'-nucleotidase SurE [Bacteroidetes bacterium]|nr:MAG: 5'/3'-nucleotidase SurE [Ignavibacteria bacterium GWA2_54_16]HCA78217.1 5'/3'-nucleotidase SurE [Bacteroidota bacterium]
METKKRRPSILVSNDDGVDAPGIYALVRELKKIGDVMVVAPDKQQSAVGHAITMNFPLRAKEFKKDGVFFGFAVEGTPADSVKLAVKAILKKKPDLLISGVNHGANTAISIIYSGTVSAATEGTILGIPSIAVSLTTYGPPDFQYAAKFARKLAQLVLKKGLPEGTLLNVNVPPLPEKEIKGVVVTRQGRAVWNDTFDVRRDPANKEYYWLTGALADSDSGLEFDQSAVRQNYVSVTPIHYDLTDYRMLEVMERWGINKLHS